MDHVPSTSARFASALLSPWGKVIAALVCLKVFTYTKIAYDQMDAEYSASLSSTPPEMTSNPNVYNNNQLLYSNDGQNPLPPLQAYETSSINIDNNLNIDNGDTPGFVQFNTVPAANENNEEAANSAMQQSMDEIQQLQQKRQQQQQLTQEQLKKDNCQIIYILGVEGAIHHGFTPILEALAKSQVDPNTGKAYQVTYAPKVLRSALFGLYQEKRDMDDPTLIAKVFRELCPETDDGKTKRIIIEDSSFPSGAMDDPRSYRIRRQASWMTSTMEEVANDELAINHPVNLKKFYELYSQHANVQFILLNRPFLETMASHANDWGEEVAGRSNMIRGFMLILKRFLDHLRQEEESSNSGGMRGGNKKKALSTIVCADKIMSKNYESDYEATMARQHILDYLTKFLGWPSSRCPECYNTWKESKKDPAKVLGEKNLGLMLNDMKELEGMWPPLDVIGSGLPEQQCSL
mmetsp:Transcript_5568/g.11744  ORF Transcript_5568/g.11744 Transcript_5568/m.11744 type:complete len:464 (-) Transcript_5568:107-1498(-)